MSTLSRRRFLQFSAAASATGLLPPGLSAAMAARPAGQSLSAVKHVVVFMQENRSFDHYFGTLPGVRGFGDRAVVPRRGGQSLFSQPNLLFPAQGPFHLDTRSTSAQYMADLDHSWLGTHNAWGLGHWDNWVPAKGPMTMGYFTRADIPYHHALADAFTVCDHYFCSLLGPTNPNRLYHMSGTIDPGFKAGGPVIDNSELGYRWTTYPERLEAAGVSWKVYQVIGDNFDDNALGWFTRFRKAAATDPLRQRGMTSVPKVTGDSVQDIVAALKNDALNGTLPQVSWIVAPEAYSEHPSGAPAAGAYMIDQVLQALTADPAVWASTVFLLNYDENDGFFDHMVPPMPPAGTPDEFVLGLPIGLGARVPMVVMSPWSRGGNVCSQVFDHTSVIRFIETWTGVKEPNISAWRRKVCGDLTSALDFGRSSVSVPALPDSAALLSVAQASRRLPAPKASQSGSLPQQEPGRRRARALPYQCNAWSETDVAGGRLRIHMDNAGTESVHYAVHPVHHRIDGPWHYDVAPGGQVNDDWHVQTYGLGQYDLFLSGPNGFVRRFAGNLHTAGAGLEVGTTVLVTGGRPGLRLRLRNPTGRAVLFTLTPQAYRTDGPWSYKVAAGSDFTIEWDLSPSWGWYDLVVSADVDSRFLRRLAGHVENGYDSLTG